MAVNPRNNHQFKHRLTCVLTIFLISVGIFSYIYLKNVSKPGTEAIGCRQDCATVGGGNGRYLNILTLNMLHGYPDYLYLEQRVDLIASEIRKLNPDFVFLQEVPFIKNHDNFVTCLAEKTGMNYVYFRANGNLKLIGFEEGQLILSRFPLQDIHFTELMPQAAFFEHRVVLHAKTETPQGGIDLYVTHLTNGATEINKAQTNALLEYVEKTATNTAVIAGDFNAAETTSQIKTLNAQWIDSYRTIHPHDSGFTCCVNQLLNGDPNSFDSRLDYLFISPRTNEVIVHDAALVWKRPYPTPDGNLWASDHIGLLVTLELVTSE
ncbi:MAG: hypothetical protein DWQ04_14030 [Chloroflexi bacterium]|nr:MAG: hypothetical protein DWQ04_14030 [Chloroflexota bacterium]